MSLEEIPPPSARNSCVRRSNPGEMLASNPAIKKPVPKIDLTAHGCRKATEYLKRRQLEWEPCCPPHPRPQGRLGPELKASLYKNHVHSCRPPSRHCLPGDCVVVLFMAGVLAGTAGARRAERAVMFQLLKARSPPQRQHS